MNIRPDGSTSAGTGNSRCLAHLALFLTVSDSSRAILPDEITYESEGGFSHHVLKSPAKLLAAFASA
jgi:hypothetical protein